MNISGVRVSLSGDDLLSIIDEFVNIEGITISKVEVDEEIKLYGRYDKGFAIDFIAGIKVTNVEDGIISAQVSSFKLAKIKIGSLIRKLALKYALKSLSDNGINYKDGAASIDLKHILKDVKYVDLDILDLRIVKDKVVTYVENVNIAIDGNLNKEYIDLKKVEEVKDIRIFEINKVKDFYSKKRQYIKDKLPKNMKTYGEYFFILSDILALIYRLLKDKRVPVKTKLVVGASVAYITLPTDFIPNNIPFIGKVDELAAVFFALDRIIKDIPYNIILENWEGKDNIAETLKRAIEYISNFTGARNFEKIYRFIEDISKL